MYLLEWQRVRGRWPRYRSAITVGVGSDEKSRENQRVEPANAGIAEELAVFLSVDIDGVRDRLRAAAYAEILPQSEPRALRILLVVAAIRGGDIALAKRAGIGQAEDLLQQFDLLDGLFRVHACSNIHNQAGEVTSNCKTRVRGPTASISSAGLLAAGVIPYSGGK